MALYLKIENTGIAPFEGFTLFGATSKRSSGNPLVIGTFGSGSKMAVGTLLRSFINPQVFCGLTKLEFFTKPVVMKGVSGDVEHQQVHVRMSGKLPDGGAVNRTEALSFVLDYGTSDWNNVGLALREFVSNAIDGEIDSTGDFAGVKMEIVDESKVRAKDGVTRVFVPLTPDVQKFFTEKGKWFLHFSEPDVVRTGRRVLAKSDRNRTDSKRAVIYRRGVYVREFMASGLPSLFDYNLDVVLNEARTFNDWEAKKAAATALRDSDRSVLSQVFKSLALGEDVWESTFDEYGLLPSSWETETEAVKASRKVEWAAAALVMGEESVWCDSSHGVIAEMVTKKGYAAIPVKSKAWLDAAKANGLRTDDVILTTDDREGRTYSEATEDVVKALDLVWDSLAGMELVAGKDKPAAGCFYQPLQGGSQTWGLYLPSKKTCFIHADISVGFTEKLVWVMVEEVCHHISGATDFSRDFQTLLVRVIGRVMFNGRAV